MFPFVLGLAAVLSASALNSVAYSYIRIAPSTTTLASGERFSVGIYVNAHEPVNAVDISLSFSDHAVEIIGIDRGESVITLWTEEPAVKNGVITLRGGTFQRGFRGEHLIATVNMKAKQAGQAEFSIGSLNLLAGDGKGTPVLTGKPEQSKANILVMEEGNEGGDIANISADIRLHLVTDIDGDGRVSLKDISAFLGAWHGRTAVYDFNNDGRMTFKDFAIILSESFFGPSSR
ncbi:cohesin domain-containing protein [Patescibacteria group bacterium]|nr:cohesin domain-containing protein [Patescibacteria group bacterium]